MTGFVLILSEGWGQHLRGVESSLVTVRSRGSDAQEVQNEGSGFYFRSKIVFDYDDEDLNEGSGDMEQSGSGDDLAPIVVDYYEEDDGGYETVSETDFEFESEDDNIVDETELSVNLDNSNGEAILEESGNEFGILSFNGKDKAKDEPLNDKTEITGLFENTTSMDLHFVSDTAEVLKDEDITNNTGILVVMQDRSGSGSNKFGIIKTLIMFLIVYNKAIF